MRFINKEKAISLMNSFGARKRPFIFIIDYLQENIIIEEASSIDNSSILYDFNGFSNFKLRFFLRALRIMRNLSTSLKIISIKVILTL